MTENNEGTGSTNPSNPNNPTARSVDSKANGIRRDLTAHTIRYDKDLAALNARLGGHDRSHKLADKKTDRLARIVASLGERVASDHETLVAELNPRFERMEELVAKGFSLDQAAAITGFTSEEVKEILAIKAEENLTYDALFAGMVDRIGSFETRLGFVIDTVAEHRTELDDHNRRLDAHGERLDGHGRQIGEHDGDIDALVALNKETSATLGMLTTSHVTMHNRVDVLEQRSRFNKTALIAGIVAGFVAFLLYVWLLGNEKINGVVHGVGSTANTNVGTFHANVDQHQWLTGFGVGLIVGALVFLILSVSNRHYVKKTKSTTTTETQTQNNQNGQNNGAPANNTTNPQGTVPPAPAANTQQHATV